MFSDFKNLTFSKVINKLTILFNIYRRLDLSNLEFKYNALLENYTELKKKLDILIKEKEIVSPIISPEEPSIPELLPDLIISSITTTMDSSDSTIIQIIIKNIGTASSNTTDITIDITTQETKIFVVPPLSINAEYHITTSVHYETEGEYEYKPAVAEVNKEGYLEELHYDNNRYDFLVAIKPAIPPSNTSFSIHAHNPEGFEIGSIMMYLRGGWLYDIPFLPTSVFVPHDSSESFDDFLGAKIYIDNKFICLSPLFLSEHNAQHLLSTYNLVPGNIYPCKAEWNGMIVDLGDITFTEDENTILEFNFPRYNTVNDASYSISGLVSCAATEYHPPYYWGHGSPGSWITPLDQRTLDEGVDILYKYCENSGNWSDPLWGGNFSGIWRFNISMFGSSFNASLYPNFPPTYFFANYNIHIKNNIVVSWSFLKTKEEFKYWFYQAEKHGQYFAYNTIQMSEELEINPSIIIKHPWHLDISQKKWKMFSARKDYTKFYFNADEAELFNENNSIYLGGHFIYNGPEELQPRTSTIIANPDFVKYSSTPYATFGSF